MFLSRRSLVRKSQSFVLNQQSNLRTHEPKPSIVIFSLTAECDQSTSGRMGWGRGSFIGGSRGSSGVASQHLRLMALPNMGRPPTVGK